MYSVSNAILSLLRHKAQGLKLTMYVYELTGHVIAKVQPCEICNFLFINQLFRKPLGPLKK